MVAVGVVVAAAGLGVDVAVAVPPLHQLPPPPRWASQWLLEKVRAFPWPGPAPWPWYLWLHDVRIVVPLIGYLRLLGVLDPAPLV